MSVYRFRVSFEDYDDIYRDIEIRPNQTFKDLHEAITQFISFETERPSSFFISDDNWKKGKEITSRPLKGEEKEKIASMQKATMRDFIADPHQKIYYMYDHNSPWAFRIELIKIVGGEDGSGVYPRCIKSIGDAPKQFTHVELLPDPEDDEFFDDSDTKEDADQPDKMHDSLTGIDKDEIPVGIEEDPDEAKEEDDEVINTDELPSDEDEY